MLSLEQGEAARKDPLSFRHAVGRGADASYSEALQWLQATKEKGAIRPVQSALFVYRQTEGPLTVTGIIADVSLRAYDNGLVKRHEDTIAKTHRKMVKYMRSTRVFGNPVAVAHRPHVAITATITAHTGREPDTSFVSADGLRHELWLVAGDEAEELCHGFNDALYITDGHHRLAAASALAVQEGRADARLPAGLFSSEELRLRSFARCVFDPQVDAAAVIDRLREEHWIEEVSELDIHPRERYEFGFKIQGRYYRMQINRDAIPDDPYASLDVNLLQELILEPVFGITSPSEDRRLRFVADLPVQTRAEVEPDAWFLPYPVDVSDVMAVADTGQTMPPKSTWFAPKLPSGLVIRMLDRT
jgi:uncharacterized protein (DUF1015 family)